MADSDGTLDERVAALEKWMKLHLGPNLAASSMNIPHPGIDSDATTLAARVTVLEASVATLQTQMTAAQAAIITSGRYN